MARSVKLKAVPRPRHLADTSMNKRAVSTGIGIAVVGIILVIVGGAYGLYLKYGGSNTRFSAVAVNPVVDALAVIGIILLIVGAYQNSKKKSPPAKVVPPKPASSSGTPSTGAPATKDANKPAGTSGSGSPNKPSP